ncbi:hypothetical protein BUALT_Bualt13G0011700 [Buddleja alternifolia]|uniref:CUE domain-containing protein n=1 Tax=Buddleja alternifolia TaxID=168488 RepID=A0AAV6WRL2_9LAMI|nr:hypothetical protein BUALT_Bualt13G0011700 [Buddleja alternifolia]
MKFILCNTEMGFNKVYKSLLEVFPQVDSRALRAVAIEHSKDADAAVEAVLVEIIPFFAERSRPSSPLTRRSISVRKSNEALLGSIVTTQTADGPSLNKEGSAELKNGYNENTRNQHSLHVSVDGHNEAFYDAYDGHHEREDNTAELTLPKNIDESSIEKNVDVYSHDEACQLIDKNGVNTLQIEVSGESITEETASDDKCPESSIKISSQNIPWEEGETLQEDIGVNQNMNVNQQTEDYVQLETEFGNGTNKESDQGKSCTDDNNCMAEPASLTVQITTSPLEISNEFVVLPDMLGSDLEKLEASLSSDADSKMEATSNVVDTEDDSTLTATISQSSQIHIIDVLEEIIADAKTNKKTLFSAMQSVISLMREVELKEQAAEQEKQEVTIGDTDIEIKVEELKQMVQRAKEANDMHAGEVYGEKAILATELKELQSRLLSLSDEKDKSLGVLDEMRQTLEIRLATAEKEIKSAEQEKLVKERAAAKALVDQELLMEKVVQESNILKQQAEDNAKLREFLMDRGRVVDILQGEIAVICQDVSLLKEKFDEHVPFSKSLSSSQTSFILASSTSSFKSLIPDQVEPVPDEAVLLEIQKKKDSSDEQSSEEKTARDYREALQDDGWEFFDNHEIYA